MIVAGVEVNPKDPSDVTVILTDPGTGDLRIEYSLDDFMDAWEDSHCFMVATDTPAPYQYDETRGVMVPSNFAYEQFIEDNSYPLSPDSLYIPEGYEAYYSEGHLNSVGHDDNGHEISFDEFHGKYAASIGNAAPFGQDHFNKDTFVNAIKGLFHPGSSDGVDDVDGCNGGNGGDGGDDVDGGNGGDGGDGDDGDDGDGDDGDDFGF